MFANRLKLGLLPLLPLAALALGKPAGATPVTSAGSLSLGSLTFSDFSCNRVGTGLPTSCGNIDVETDAGLPGLTFQSYFADAGEFAAGEDFLVSYAVTDHGAPITALDLAFNGSAVSFGGFAVASVTETAYTRQGGRPVGQLTVSCSDPGACNTDSSYSVLPIGSYTSLYVTKDILLGNLGPGLETISYIGQSFHQVPEPMTIAVLGTGLVGLGLARRHRTA